MFTATRLSEASSIVTLRVFKEEPAVHSKESNGFHLVLLIDTSLSMEGERINTVQRTIHALIDLMTLNDRLSIIEWSNTANILCKLNSNKEELRRAVNSIKVRGGTCMEAGISALGSFTAEERSSIDGVFLLTDGEINQGLQTPTGLRFLFRLLLPASVPIFTVGYGADHNAKLLQSLAIHSHGSYTFASAAEVIPAAIGDIVGGFRSEFAREGVLQLPDGGSCLELGSEEDGASVALGSWMYGKSHWYVFDLPTSTDSIYVKWKQQGDPHDVIVHIASATSESEPDVYAQWFRVRFIKLIQSLDSLGREESVQRLQELDKEILQSIAASLPLVVSLRAQINDHIQKQTTSTYTHEDEYHNVSDITVFATQRGILSQGDADMFASPVQRMISDNMVSAFTTRGSDPC